MATVPQDDHGEVAAYIVQAYESTEISAYFPDQRVFGNPGNKSSQSPILTRDRVNRILIYPGCFNPPHIGHLRLLDSTLKGTKEKLGVVAAIIIMGGDDAVAKKANVNYVVPKQYREAAWTNHPEFPPEACIFQGRRANFTEFWLSLLMEVRNDGFMLEYVMLYGPEYVPLNGRIVTPTHHGCPHIVTSNASRPVEFIGKSGELLPLEGWTPWKEFDCADDREISSNDDEENAPDTAYPSWYRLLFSNWSVDRGSTATSINRVLGPSEEMLECFSEADKPELETPAELGRRPNVLHVCQREKLESGLKRSRLFFVAASRQEAETACSTDIRYAIQTLSGETLLKELKRLGALCPDLLFTVVCNKNEGEALGGVEKGDTN